jgi:hypothetical protein
MRFRPIAASLRTPRVLPTLLCALALIPSLSLALDPLRVVEELRSASNRREQRRLTDRLSCDERADVILALLGDRPSPSSHRHAAARPTPRVRELQTLCELDAFPAQRAVVHELLALNGVIERNSTNCLCLPFIVGCDPERGVLSLDLLSQGLRVVPPSISALTELSSMDLSLNQLHELPDEIGALSKLRFLYLTHNFLTALPASIGNLTLLRYCRPTPSPFSLASWGSFKTSCASRSPVTASPHSPRSFSTSQASSPSR